MNINPNYKIFKYFLKFKKSIGQDDLTKTNKYFGKLKTYLATGGSGIEPELNAEKQIESPDQAKKIAKFINKNLKKITLGFLTEICSDSNECVTFGIEVDKIKKYFDNFVNFNLVKEFKVLSSGSQGMVKLIKYEKNNYETYAILKLSKTDTADNPYYEYLVGNFLNTQLKFFPCFVQTYGLFEYDGQSFVNYEDKSFASIISDRLKQVDDTHSDIHLVKSCVNPTKFCILTQYLKNSITMKKALEPRYSLKYDSKYNEWYEDKRDYKYIDMAQCDFYINEIPYILFQIYMPLYILSDVFAHFDLHWNNILLYEPVKGKTIKYIYYLSDGEVISFYSPYIVKLIDYGRSYFSNEHTNSQQIFNKICSLSECGPDCGKSKGYVELSVKKKNTSIDLRIFDYLQSNLSSMAFERITEQLNSGKDLEKNKLDNLTKYFELQNKVIDMDRNFTKVLLNEITDEYNGLNINNVKDLFIELKKLIQLESFQLNNKNTYGLDENKIYGELHVYSDKQTPCKFIKK